MLRQKLLGLAAAKCRLHGIEEVGGKCSHCGSVKPSVETSIPQRLQVVGQHLLVYIS